MTERARLNDEAVREAPTQVHGIDPWTADMLLIFDLGRLDILSVTDYGVRKGFALTSAKGTLPPRKH